MVKEHFHESNFGESQKKDCVEKFVAIFVAVILYSSQVNFWKVFFTYIWLSSYSSMESVKVYLLVLLLFRNVNYLDGKMPIGQKGRNVNSNLTGWKRNQNNNSQIIKLRKEKLKKKHWKTKRLSSKSFFYTL